ncbi:MAG: thiolase domain-containing protein [Candidatus Zixiibacteriota bacterium]|nr:MAG: thiolase domain-containing protein [candidate division Zixibacteria bacterium]
MRDVAVVGIGMNKWGELWDKSIRDIFVEAALTAIDDAGVDMLDSMAIGCMTGGLFVGQEHLASMMADYLGYKNLAASRVESACASGGLAFRTAFIEVASGISDVVLAGGVEKMTDVSGDGATYALATAADQEYEVFHGATFPGLYALMAVAHMEKYGTTRDMLSAVAVKNHVNGSMNPNAQYPFKISVEDVNNSVMVASPLRILDCSPITDGAAAVILTTVDIARKLGKPIIKIIGSGHATDTIALHARKDLTTLNATKIAAERAFKMAGKTIKDIDFAEVHDCFTIAEIVVTESLGIFAPGKGGEAAANGETSLEGSFPINTSGGLKSKGHPVGATGIGQVVEVVKQLRGEAENGRQLKKNPKTAMTQNMGGSGGSTLVHILEVA